MIYDNLNTLFGLVLIVVIAFYTIRYKNWLVAVVLVLGLVNILTPQPDNIWIVLLADINRGLLAYLLYRYMVMDDYIKKEQTRLILASIVEGTNLSVIGIDADMRIVSWNKGAEKIYGWRAEELYEKNLLEVIVPVSDIPATKNLLESVMNGKKLQVYRAARRHKNGSLVEVEQTVSPIYKSDSRIIGASIISREVNEDVE